MNAEMILQRLFQARRINEKTECWEWTRSCRDGYGQTQLFYKTYPVHRLSAHVYLGLDLNDGLNALHKCDNRKCFNPAHLFLGTAKDNAVDRKLKGRNRRYGRDTSGAKVSSTGVLEIKKRRSQGETWVSIAKPMGITPKHAQRLGTDYYQKKYNQSYPPTRFPNGSTTGFTTEESVLL